tara:strand:- start:106 stop:873 length:768 start_codon:yes stop_codon:yes gene_type:complete
MKIMKITFAGSQNQESKRHYAATYLIDEILAVDAGTLGLINLDTQKQIRHVLLSHAHADHIATLPIFLDNVYQSCEQCPQVHAHPDVLTALRTHVFNGCLWPDIEKIAREESPVVQFHELQDQQTFKIEQYEITPVLLNHGVTTLGFLIDDGISALAIVSDTSPTESIWNVVSKVERLKAVILEASFPNSLDWLANKSMHLTPAMLKLELKKLPRNVTVIATHLKPAYHDEIVEELRQLHDPFLSIGEPGQVYEF